jgi:ribosomal protein S18 acetylase RimI-like enzyme
MRSKHEDKIDIVKLDEYSEELFQVSKKIFDENNAPFTEPYQKQDYRLALKDEEKIIGSLTGYSGFDWFYIESLTVERDYRDNDYATQLVQMAEQEAKDRGCFGIWLHTISFQAPEFYKKLGYEEFERFENLPKGHERIFLKKYL